MIALLIGANAESSSIFDFLSKDKTQGNKTPLAVESNSDDVKNFFNDHPLSIDNNKATSCGEAKLIAINKITASSQLLTVKINRPVFFHNLELNVHKCVKTLDSRKSDSYGLLTLTEYKVNDDAKVVFQGWLLASSISLSNFENPVYEVFIKECL